MNAQLLLGDALGVLATLPDASVDCCITSPPYFGLRDYGVQGQIGLERSPREYVAALVQVFEQVRRVLKPEGTLWLNLGDSYAGSGKGRMGDGKAEASGKQASHAGSIEGVLGKAPTGGGLKEKDLIGIPWRVAFALQDAGWWLRSDIIWAKANPMPESVKDRPTRAHEYVFLLAKSEVYHYDAAAIAEPANYPGKITKTRGNDGMDGGYDGHRTRDGFRRGVVTPEHRNARDVWTFTSEPFAGAHFATMPLSLARRMVLAGCPAGGVVLDPFSGAATTGFAALQLGRSYIGIELNPEYLAISQKRLKPLLAQPTLEVPF